MQQIVYDLIDKCIPNEPNNSHESNSVHSDITIKSPLSTKNGSNNSSKESQKDIKHIKKKIFFIDYNNKNKKNINNNKKEKKFLTKKRKRFFLIKKIQKKKKKTPIKKLPKVEKIFFSNFRPNTPIENNQYKDNNINNSNNNKKKSYIFKNIFVNREYNINNNIIKQDENKNNNIKIFKNEKIINKNKTNINTNLNNINKNIVPTEEKKEKEKEKEEINTNNTNNNTIINKEKEVRKKKKKSSYTTEKELQIAFEKKFLENINKEYSDKEYEEDMKQCLKDKRKKFMKDNFPIMFKKDKFYLYSKLKKKRLASRDYFIETDFFEKNKNDNNLEIYFNNSDIDFNNQKKDVNCCNNKIFKIFKTKKFNKNNNNLLIDKNNNNKLINENSLNNSNNFETKEKIFLIPKKVWSLKKDKDINIDNFFEECSQIWPNDECCFTKEIALEFLMQNNYSVKYCLDNMDEFVFFMKKRAKELDFPVISESIKTIKRYHLRKTNFN